MAIAPWSLGRRIGFRFGVIAAGLLMLPIGMMITGSRSLYAVWVAAVTWFAKHVLGIVPPEQQFTGSGDTAWHYVELAMVVTIAVIGTVMWTAVDRRRAYPRLAAAATVIVRYYLAFIMIGYGVAKLLPMQFQSPLLIRYDQSIGEMSPMGLLWTFMGHSTVYTFFVGLAECVGAVLLMWRRTYVIGALVTAAVMLNVVLLNFCYDVPVKLFSIQLLMMSLVLIAPHTRRVMCALLGRTVPEVPPRVRSTRRAERVRLIAKLAMFALLAVNVYAHYDVIQRHGRPQPTALHGIWNVDRFVIDGVERPPLFTDDTRWRKMIVFEYGLMVRYATERRAHYATEIDDTAHTITIMHGVTRQVLRYERANDRLTIGGTFDDHTLHLELSLDPAPLLSKGGFHWIQDEPFYR